MVYLYEFVNAFTATAERELARDVKETSVEEKTFRCFEVWFLPSSWNSQQDGSRAS